MKSIRTKALEISKEVKQNVHERDNGYCIFCGLPVPVMLSNAHIVPRSKGGLGIEENIITCCLNCHNSLDQSTSRKDMLELAKKYIMSHYPNWNENDMMYRKGKGA